MPADLLALIPRPVCDNCGYFEAYNECSHCQELFCQQCFTQVHFGGRRKEHEFRCLYDFYNNRIDYRDDEFPSKWPSEIMQDEVQGWMLRVAPIRNPTSIWGSWEIYDSEVATGDGSVELRRFYFNRDTFEATYHAPRDLDEHLLQLDYGGELNDTAQLEYHSDVSSTSDQGMLQLGLGSSKVSVNSSDYAIEEGSDES